MNIQNTLIQILYFFPDLGSNEIMFLSDSDILLLLETLNPERNSIKKG